MLIVKGYIRTTFNKRIWTKGEGRACVCVCLRVCVCVGERERERERNQRNENEFEILSAWFLKQPTDGAATDNFDNLTICIIAPLSFSDRQTRNAAPFFRA